MRRTMFGTKKRKGGVMNKYGARIYPLKLKVIVIKQCIKKPGSSNYVVDRLEDGRQREKHISLENSEGIADAVQRALKGEQQSE